MKRAWWFLLFSVLLVIAAIRLPDIHTDINDFLFAGGDEDFASLAGRLQSEELSRRYLISLLHAQVDDQTRFDFLLDFQQALESDPAVARVWTNQTSDETLRALLDVYLSHRIQLFSLNPEEAFPHLFTQPGLDAQASKIKQALLGPDPILVNSLIIQDPMLLTLNWLEQLEQRLNRQQDKQGYSAVFVETRASGMESLAQQEFQQHIQRQFERINRNYGNPMQMEMTGVPIFAVAIKQAVSNDIHTVSSLSLAAILLLFILVFRSIRALLATVLVMMTTVSVAVLATFGLFGFVHGLTLALGTTLIGVCIDYPIHAMVHGARPGEEGRRHRVSQIWPAMLVGGVTTVIGYIALGLSGFPGLQQIALFSAAGIFTALLLTRFILPDLMDLLTIDMHPRLRLGWLLNPPRRNRLRLLILIGALVGLLSGIGQLRWSTDLATLSPAMEGLKQVDQEIRSRLVSMEPGRFILAEGETLEQALQTSENLESRLQRLQQTGDLDTYYSLFPWLASADLQERNQTAWNRILTDQTQQAFERALSKQGLVAKAFPPLTLSSETPLDLDTLRNTPAWSLIVNQLIRQSGRVAVVIWLGRHEPDKVSSTIADLPQVRYFSQKETVIALAETYRERALTMLLVGILAILVLLIWRYRSLLQAVRVLMPATVSLLLVLAGWSLSNQPLGMLHLIGLLLAAAICVDYGVFFMENRAADRQLTFQAIAASAFTSALSFSCLAAAETPALHALAFTVAPGVLLGFLLCPIMLGSSNSVRISPG